jgi:hypothetical protein
LTLPSKPLKKIGVDEKDIIYALDFFENKLEDLRKL